MLDLLDFTLKISSYPNLEKIGLIGAQHLMESTLKMIQTLNKAGLKPENTFLIGKAYSTNPEIISELRYEGNYIDNGSSFFNSHLCYDSVYKNLIKTFAKTIINKINIQKIDMVIILDDGGYLIEELSNTWPYAHIKLSAIEQTSAGIYHINSILDKLKIPVINVARSTAKLKLETPFIVESAINRLYKMIPENQLFDSNILILGNGSIGQKLKTSLSEKFKVASFDIKENNNTQFISLLKWANIILGCTGQTSLSFETYQVLEKDVILASVSSSDREFEAYKFRQQFAQNNNSHTTYSRKNITLLESGCPINFWGSRNNIELKYIQITLALLMSAIFQATKLSSNSLGIIDLDKKNEFLISTFFSSLLTKIKDDFLKIAAPANSI